MKNETPNWRQPTVVLATVAAIALLLSGCSSQSAVTKGLNCFPQASAAWIGLADGAVAPVAGDRPEAKGTIYVDRSTSMTGYLAGATTSDRPFQDLIGAAASQLKEIGVDARYRAFGTTIVDVPGPTEFARSAYFACGAKGAPGCESHLDAVLGEIAAKPDDLAIVVSDMWFDNSTTQTSGLTDLQPLLAKILESRRTMELYGIDAPFSGKIYDLPTTSGSQSITFNGRHPLFMLVIGSKRQILGFETRMARWGSSTIAQAMIDGRIHRSIFTVDPQSEHARSDKPLEPGNSPEVEAVRLESFGNASIQQFSVTRPTSLAVKGAVVHGPRWTGPPADAFLANAVWEGPLTPSVQIWRRIDQRCSPKSWIAMGSVDGGWEREAVDPSGARQWAAATSQEAVPTGARMRFTLDPARLYGRVRQNGTYLLTGELRRTSVMPAGPATAWMRTWSLEPEQADQAARQTTGLFPTLNLATFARIMEDALATAAERKGGGITGFSVQVKVAR